MITFKKDIKSTLSMVEATPLLTNDFQVIVDSSGNIYQFDFDRVFLGGLYQHNQFNNKLAKAYDEATSMLRKMEVWSSEEQTTRDSNQTGEAVLTSYLNNTNSWSCKAIDTVTNMSGRIRDGEGKELARAARLMMVDLVQTVMFDTGQYGGPKGKQNGMLNCRL